MAAVLSPKRRLWMAAVLGSLAAFGPLTIDMYLPSFPSISDDLQTSASLVQLSLTACLLGLAIGQLVMGPMSDVRGRKGPLLGALAAFFVASILCAVAPTIWVLIICRFIQGFAASAGIVISRAIVRDLFQGKELTKFFALLMLVNGLAPILAPVFGGIILEFTIWNGIFIVLSAVSIIMFATVVWGLPETLPVESRSKSNIGQTIRTFGSLMKDRAFTGYSLAQGFKMAGIFAYVSGTPFIYQGIYGVSPTTFSLLFGMNGIGLIIGTQVVGRLAGIVPEKKLLSIGLVLTFAASTVLLVMTLIEAPLIGIVIPIFIIVFCVGIIATTSFSLAMETQGHRAGSASALLGLLPFILGAAAAPLVGIAGEDTAVPMGVVIFTADGLALLAYLLLVRDRKSDNQEPSPS